LFILGSYPDTKPNIIIRCPVLTTDELTELEKAMDIGTLGEPMIQAMLQKAEEYINRNKLDISSKQKPGNGMYKNTERKNKERRRKRKEKLEEEEVKNEKKASMKTVEDVIKRIQWDANLPQDEFVVGYIDRFLGIQEKYFTSFSWEDLASVDYSVLAVPKHRIEYFKYKDVKVWDKPRRIDNVFGSTGSKTTIYDVIANYQKARDETMNKPNTTEEEGRNDDSSDDDSDDGITVTVGGGATSYQSDDDSGDESKSIGFDEDICDDGFDKYWRNKLRPNYFLAFRVQNPEVVHTTEGIQDVILDHEPQFESCCIPLHCLHVTLCTLGLDTPEQVTHCAEVLNRLKPELISMAPKDKPLVFKGLGQFFNRVLYAKVTCSDEMYEFVDHVKLCLKNEGIEIRDNHDFVPHMTIMKVTRPVGHTTGKKYIPPWVYSHKGEVDFGEEVFNNIHLCKMSHERREDGFYFTPTSLSF
jgi:2'-5' RNA ligase